MDYSEIAFGTSTPSSGVPRTPEQAAADLAKAQAAFGAIGVDIGKVTKGLNIPQQGFTDPRTAAQLLTAPAFPKTREENTDGSGVNTINQPAQRNPQLTGFPSVSPLAINDPKLAPSQVTEKLKSLITDISGPKAGSLTVDIAGGAAGAASALNPSALVGGLQNQLQGLLPNVNTLAGSIAHLPTGALSLNASSLNNISSPLSGLSGQVSSLVSGLTSSVTSGISGAVGSITDAQKAQATADFAKAQATITAGLGKATASASNMAAKAQESLGLKTDLSSLRSGATDISSKIFDKLKGFAPANIITKIPVLAVTEIKTPVAATGVSTVADPVPNPIPPNVPLYQANSSQKKSIENCIYLFEEYTSKRINEINQALYATKTKKEYQAVKAQINLGSSKTDALIEKLVAAAGNDGPELRTTLIAIRKDYTGRINEGLTQYYDTLPEG
jgi:hypothetical protein